MLYNGVTFTVEEEVAACVKKWQKRLRLQDWWIYLRIKRARDMSFEDSQGSCNWNLLRKTAVIELLDPIDWDDSRVQAQDHEMTIVHELLHLHFAALSEGVSYDDLQRVTEEQSIIALTEALVGLDRELEEFKQGPVYETLNPGGTD